MKKFLVMLMLLASTALATAKPVTVHYVSQNRIGWECFSQTQTKGCAFTWPKFCEVFINRDLSKKVKQVVLKHELGHCNGTIPNERFQAPWPSLFLSPMR